MIKAVYLNDKGWYRYIKKSIQLSMFILHHTYNKKKFIQIKNIIEKGTNLCSWIEGRLLHKQGLSLWY